MAFITYRFADGTRKEIEVTEEFAAEYAEMDHKDALIERKETRRHSICGYCSYKRRYLNRWRPLYLSTALYLYSGKCSKTYSRFMTGA